MLTLDKYLTLDDDAVKSANLTGRFEKADLERIGEHVWEGYDNDRFSRAKWEKRTQAAMDLAMQVQKTKSFPWPNCSNIQFPLITIGALQFHSRAYPAIISGLDVVKCRVIGEDPTGEKTKRADRISRHMSWQVLEEQQEWEEQKDRLLINLPIVGTCFVKSYYDGDKGRRIDETVLAQDLVIDYWAKSVESCPRKTHIIPFSRNDIHSGIAREIYRDVSEEDWYGQPANKKPDGTADAKRDNRIGQTPPQPDEVTPFIFLEQHVDMDLDGDGYAEPYIITIEETSKSVIRIVCGFDRPQDILRTREGKVISISRMEYFTKYSFIPSPDGGIYDIGLGVLIGPLNEAVDSIINQSVDLGTMQNTRGGFLGKGAKVRGGQITFSPFQWQRIDSNGDDIRKNLVQLEVGDHSPVLFNLLSLLINYVERITGTTDPQVGENPGQNTPAETSRNMLMEGRRVYSAVFKRIWRSMKQEFRKGYILNGLYMPLKRSFGEGQMALREDYLGNPDEVAPAADPNLTSEEMAFAQAMTLKQMAAQTPGYDAGAVERRVLKLMKVEAIDQIYPGVEKTGAPKDVKIQVAEMKVQVDMAWLQHEQQKFAATLMEEIRFNDAEIARILAEIQNMQEVTEGDRDDRMIGMLNAQLGLLKARNDTVNKQFDLVMTQMDVRMKELELQRAETESRSDGGNVRRLAGASGNRSNSSGARKQAA